ncbi:3-isopropylmalate dehydratase large subunit [Candidatus Sulcia muelleri]|uniref:3-isopropylmalate dehydratase large subunit n=1 Tax=Candidatus Karelsulcia muelleri TaxID=336810 RepID=UPI000BD51C1B|nr:3-isopropylmalate dehydratase large subunit [Candidatus Karelsulcia muelleri]NHU72526.1 3-isopropylmalate dehydratase large subunit [Candidatus Karelsulcia muelleri]
MNKTLFEKIWESHVVFSLNKKIDVLYIDRHYIHEVTSPQAFEELKKRKISILKPNKIIATTDHNVPTTAKNFPIKDVLSKFQIEKLKKNCNKNGILFFGLKHDFQGIIHVIGPELGITLPGMTIVCGDSHTSTHGAFGCIAFGIGTSQVAMVMATQCLLQSKPKQMRLKLEGNLNLGVTAKDIILYIISKLGPDGGTGYFIEYSGSVFKKMNMEERMTVCNMSIEMGARGGMIEPDTTTLKYLDSKIFSPKKKELNSFKKKCNNLKTDKKASFEKEYKFNSSNIYPMITYGTNPSMGIKISDSIPKENNFEKRNIKIKSIKYMGLKEGESLLGLRINYIFIGSCTNSRIEDIKLISKIIKNKKKAENVYVLVVPGSKQVYKQILKKKIDLILLNAGFELRLPGCSACLGMNEDKIPSGEYCLSTSNRNFEGRQGKGARTLLASPLVAAITALEGKIVNISEYLKYNPIN